MNDSKPNGSEPIIGSLREADGKGIVRIEDRFDTGIDDVWSALIDPDRLARWLGAFHGDLRLGGEFRANFWASGWEGSGRVEACEPPHHLLILTRDTESADEHAIEAWLHEDSENTVLVIEEQGIPLAHLSAYGAGVQIHVEDLAAHLAGRPRCDAKVRWEQLRPTYRDMSVTVGYPHPLKPTSRGLGADHPAGSNRRV